MAELSSCFAIKLVLLLISGSFCHRQPCLPMRYEILFCGMLDCLWCVMRLFTCRCLGRTVLVTLVASADYKFEATLECCMDVSTDKELERS